MTYFYHAVVDSPHLPRDLGLDSAQSAITTLMGELWPPEMRVALPSAGLVSLLERIGFSETATRGALSRMSRRGTLDAIKVGRSTFYRMSEEVASSIPRSEVLTMGFGRTQRPWNGEWTIVVFSMPESQRERRQSLRDWLRWLGFGPIRDGVWISPHADVDLTHSALSGLLPDDGVVFRSAQVVGQIHPDDVWPLGEIAALYREFVETFRPRLYELRAGAVSPAGALRLWMTVLGRWRGFPTVDPDLPEGALPFDWPRREARRVFEAVHDASLPYAAELVRRHFSALSPAVGESMRVMTVSESLASYTAAVQDEDEIRLSDVAPSLLPSGARAFA